MPKIVKPSIALVSRVNEENEVLDAQLLRVSGGLGFSNKEEQKALQEDIYLSGVDVGKPDVVVKTKGASFKKLCNDITKEQATLNFKEVWRNIKAVDTDKAFAEQGEEWSNLCDDIALFYACRYILFKMPAPVVNPSLLK